VEVGGSNGGEDLLDTRRGDVARGRADSGIEPLPGRVFRRSYLQDVRREIRTTRSNLMPIAETSVTLSERTVGCGSGRAQRITDCGITGLVEVFMPRTAASQRHREGRLRENTDREGQGIARTR